MSSDTQTAEILDFQDRTTTWEHIPILITGRRQDEIAKEAWSAIVAMNEKPGQYGLTTGNLFMSGGRLAFLNQNTEPPQIESATQAGLFAHANQAIEWRKVTLAGEQLRAQPQWLKAELLATPRADLPRLNRVATTPFFDKDGNYIARNGYDAQTGTWVDLGGLSVPPVLPKKVSAKALKEAVSFFVNEVLGDFPFASQADRANAVGLFILPLVMDMVDGPYMAWLVEANMPGSGKTLLAKLVSVVATGAPAIVTPLAKNEAEIKKAVTATLASGAPLTLFDNVSGYLDSPTLAAVLSATVWRDRILGGSTTATIPITTQTIFTGNNLSLSGELADRLLRVRLVPQTEHPRQRSGFRHGNIESWLIQNRDRAVFNAALLVWNWILKGSPYSGAVQGTYESFSHVIGGILETAGIDDFLGNRNEFVSQSATTESEWAALVEAWLHAHDCGPVTANQLNELAERDGLLVFIRGESSQATRLSRKLKTVCRERIFHGHQICHLQTGAGQANRFFLRPIKES